MNCELNDQINKKNLLNKYFDTSLFNFDKEKNLELFLKFLEEGNYIDYEIEEKKIKEYKIKKINIIDEVDQIFYDPTMVGCKNLFYNQADSIDKIKLVENNEVNCNFDIKNKKLKIETPKLGDYCNNFSIKFTNNFNINKILISDLDFNIGGSTYIHASIMFLSILSKYIQDKKIINDYVENNITIFIYLFEMNNLKCLPITSLHYNTITIEINYNEDISNEIVCQTNYGWFEFDYRNELLRNSLDFIFLNSNKQSIIIDDYITYLSNLNINLLNIFIIIWYIIDVSDFAEFQSLAPKLMKVVIKCENYPEKEYDLPKIKIIKNEKYIGYVIPTSLLKFDEFIEIFKEKNITKKIGKIKKKIFNWNNIDKTDLTLYWENFHPGSEIIIECINFNHGIITNGMFGTRYTN